MVKSPFVLAAIAAPFVVAAAPAASPDLAKVQAHLAAVQSMTATFSQTDRNGKILNGTLSLKRPGKIRFQYEKGVPILVVADGNSLWFLDYSVKQKQRWPIGGSPLGVLLDPSKDIGRYAKMLPTADSGILSIEVNDPRHPEYGRITMIFEKKRVGPRRTDAARLDGARRAEQPHDDPIVGTEVQRADFRRDVPLQRPGAGRPAKITKPFIWATALPD